MRVKLISLLLLTVALFSNVIAQPIADADMVNVSMDLPMFINPGSEVVVNMLVERGKAEGFVKVEEFFPIGIKVTPVELAGADFIFVQNYLSLTWKDIPKEDELKLKFKINIPATLEGKAKVEGRVNFMLNNKLKKVDFQEFYVTFQKEDADEETTKELETPINVHIGEAVKSKTSIEKQAKPEINITVNAKRTITVLSANEVSIQTKIDQSNLTGFLKSEDLIPAGFKVRNESAGSSTFSFIDNKAKYVWSEVPKETSINTSYVLVRDGSDAKTISLDGTIQYLDKGESKVVELKDKDVNIEFLPVANTAKLAAIETPQKAESTTNVKTPAKVVAPKKEAKKAVTVSQNKASELPTSTSGIMFKVQVCATQNKSTADKVSSEFNIAEAIETEMHEGWHKYTIGRFNNYNEAKAFREAKSSIPTSPFVSAYYNGRRVTVQEALMISSQKLMK